MLKEFFPDLIRRRLTSPLPEELTEDITCEHDVVQRHHRIDVAVLVWMLILGFTVDGGPRTIVGFQRVYAAATNQTLSRSSFYDRFTPALRQPLSDLLEHALEEVAVPYTPIPQLQQPRDVMIVDATAFRLHRLLSGFSTTHPDQPGAKLHLVHDFTKQIIGRFELTDERDHESSQFRTGNWLRGRLLLPDLGFYSCRRFTLTEKNDGFFLSRLKIDASP